MMVLGVDWMISFFFFGFVDVTSSDDSDIRRLLFRKKNPICGVGRLIINEREHVI
jgi:hypothetical protein